MKEIETDLTRATRGPYEIPGPRISREESISYERSWPELREPPMSIIFNISSTTAGNIFDAGSADGYDISQSCTAAGIIGGVRHRIAVNNSTDQYYRRGRVRLTVAELAAEESPPTC